MKKFLGPYQNVPSKVFIIFFARMVNSAGHFVMPFMTFFLSDKLGFTAQRTGFYMMLAALAYIPGSFIGGKLSDHLGRKTIYVLFQSLAALSFIPCAFINNSPILPWLLILSNVFGGAASPANGAMVADLTNSSNRKESYSLLYLGHNLGFAIGPMVAGLLYNNYLSWIFIGDALTTFLSILLVILYIPETIPDQEMNLSNEAMEINEKGESGGLLSAMIKRPILMMFLFCIMLLSFAYVQHMFTLPLQMKQIFGIAQGTKYYGFLMTINALTVVIFTAIITHFTLKLKPIFCVGLGGLFYAVGFGMLAITSTLYLFIFSAFIWTLGEILIATNAMAYVANNTPITHRGRFNAIVPIIAEAGHALGPFLTGLYLMRHQTSSVWIFAFFGCALVAISLFALNVKDSKKIKESNEEGLS